MSFELVITKDNIDKIVPCDVCKKPIEATPEAINAWDDLVHYDCLCVDCYWSFETRVYGQGMVKK